MATESDDEQVDVGALVGEDPRRPSHRRSGLRRSALRASVSAPSRTACNSACIVWFADALVIATHANAVGLP